MNDIKENVMILTVNLTTLSINLSDVNLIFQIILTGLSIIYVGYKLIKRIKNDE